MNRIAADSTVLTGYPIALSSVLKLYKTKLNTVDEKTFARIRSERGEYPRPYPLR